MVSTRAISVGSQKERVQRALLVVVTVCVVLGAVGLLLALPSVLI